MFDSLHLLRLAEDQFETREEQRQEGGILMPAFLLPGTVLSHHQGKGGGRRAAVQGPALGRVEGN